MKRLLALLLCITTLTACLGLTAGAEDAADNGKPYLVLGADLNADQLATVLDLLEVENPATYQEDYNVSYTTNEEEYQSLGDYLDSSVIGSKAYSSIKLTPQPEGSGISIVTRNISYCTVSMYQNALITAGVSDVDLVVAGPSNISGTAALVSATKAYEIMTGQKLDSASVDAANNELVVTGELAELLEDPESAAELIATVKNELFADGTDITEEDINDAIDQVCIEMNITLDEATRQMIIDLMNKIAATDFDINALKEQASDLFNRVSQILDNAAEQNGGAQNFFQKLIQAIQSFFQQFFG